MEIAAIENDEIASHAITRIIEGINDSLISKLYKLIFDDKSGGIVLKILTEAEGISRTVITEVYQSIVSDERKKKWCAMTIG
jgi:hypothetical protein